MIYFYLANGFEETEMIYPLDLCLRAGLEAKTVSITKEKAVTGSHGITVIADMSIFDDEYDMKKADCFVLPGGMPGASNLELCMEVQDALQYAYDNGKYICAICAAPYILGKKTFLYEKRAVCYPSFREYLFGAEIPENEKCVTDGKIITAVGAGAAVDFGLAIISALLSPSDAERIKNAILL
jgi:4-methyl-5(b-hydroxyethyl)-thiazole monophosphate biosynthesis